MTPLDPDALPTFTTARLTLRRRTLADLDACLAMDRDPLVTRPSPAPGPMRPLELLAPLSYGRRGTPRAAVLGIAS